MRGIGLSRHDYEGHKVSLCGVCKMSPGILGIPAQKPEHQVTDGTQSKSGSGNANASPFI